MDREEDVLFAGDESPWLQEGGAAFGAGQAGMRVGCEVDVAISGEALLSVFATE